MTKILIQTGKFGDVLNILPIAHAAHLRGERYGIMVCSEFSSVLDGVSYADKIVFEGKPWEIQKAFEQAKTMCDNVVVTQVNGQVDVIQKYAYEPVGQPGAVTDSFCRESWKLAGCLKEWGKTPLVFDQRNPEREKAIMPKGWFGPGKKKQIILVSAGSASSHFPYRNLLFKLLRLNYPKFNIIDLAEIKSERIYDLLGLFEAAHCLVTVDTAHLHLAAAVPNLPVMALIQDRPIYWHGSAWRPQHHFYCRYRDFPWRCLEMFDAIDNIGSKPLSNILHCYYGSVRQNDFARYFPIQYGSCRRDAANVLNDKEHFPMLQDVIRMIMQVAKPESYIVLTREDVKVDNTWLKGCVDDMSNSKTPCYAYRMNRDKSGNDTFFPAVDLFAAPVDFWVRIFPLIPDVVMGIDSMWSRILMHIFQKHGATEIEGVYRNEHEN